jgi:hypothetical protein
MNMFKESFTEYNESSDNTLSGPQAAFSSSLNGSILKENYDGSGNNYNTYNTYTSYYTKDDRRLYDRREHERIEKEKKEKEKEKSELSDNSLLFMGLGVAGLGAAVIVVMALRK